MTRTRNIRLADGCSPLPGAAPWGSGLSPQTGGRQTNQAANTTRAVTVYPTNADIGLTPWSFWTGTNFLENTTRSVEGVTASGGPVTWVVTCNGAEVSREPEFITELPTSRQRIVAEGVPYVRLQAVVEWSSGTGTNEFAVLDVNAGFVFRVFGTVARVYLFGFPGRGFEIADNIPQTTIIRDDNPVQVTAPSYGTSTLFQASVQTSKNRSEGFPGSWQCTGSLSEVNNYQVYVPPFARQVQVLQSSVGTRPAFLEWLDVFGRVIGTVYLEPGQRQSAMTRVPSGARQLRVPAGSIVAATNISAVFEVSQF